MEYIANDPFSGGSVRIMTDQGMVTAFDPVETVDADLLLTSGFCDLQVNGAFGIDLNGAALTNSDVRMLNQGLLKTGVTAWCPTIITGEHSRMLQNLAVIDTACREDPLTADCIVGIHLEGPYLSEDDGARGAHPRAYVRDPNFAEFEAFQRAAGGRIRIITIAPERTAAVDLIKVLSRQGIIAALGHTMATPAQIRDAVLAGARLATHLGNGLPAMLPRHKNPFLSLLTEDALFASVIFDGHHLPRQMRTLIARGKGMNRLVMVSDSTSLTGMPPGQYDEAVGGMVKLSADGRLSLVGTPYLAGSAMTLLDDVNVMVGEDGFSLTGLLALSMTNPRTLLGLDTNSYVILRKNPQTNQLEVICSIINDQVVYSTMEEENE